MKKVSIDITTLKVRYASLKNAYDSLKEKNEKLQNEYDKLVKEYESLLSYQENAVNLYEESAEALKTAIKMEREYKDLIRETCKRNAKMDNELIEKFDKIDNILRPYNK